MGWRMAASWALLGFAAQCFIGLYRHDTFEEAVTRALVHYVAWGCAGFLVGAIFERAVEDSFRNYVRAKTRAMMAKRDADETEPPAS